MVILDNKPKYFFQTRWFRIALIAVGAVVVIALVVFNEQLGSLLKFFGSQADTSQTVRLDQSNFLPAENQTPPDSFQMIGGKLRLNNSGQ